jgi:DNA-binding FadR family transcriptional regulator
MGRAAGGTPVIPADSMRRLAERILAESARAGLRPGSRLPTERQLAADLGMTRSSVRHALAVLEAAGHVSREVGRGTFLRDVPAHNALGSAAGVLADGRVLGGGSLGSSPDGAGLGADNLGGFAPADVMTIRRLLEPLAMPLVVAWATASDFKEMDRCLAGGERAASFEEFETWDLALHRGIMAASHSPLLASVYSVIETARHGHVWGDMKRRSASRQRQELYQQDHRELVAALRARDSDGAVAAMRAHLSRVNSNLFGDTR